jgi:ring-1,2-phenylacetyl-CoA epoxidase subunit PaaE
MSRHSNEQLDELLKQARAAGSARAVKGQRERTLEIVDITRTTDDSVQITLAQDANDPLRFTPGQFVTVIAEIDGEEVRRAYSFCSPPEEEETFSIAVKRVESGRMSNHLNDHAVVGGHLRISGPNGRFGTTPDASRQRHVVLIGGGSGITPLHSIASSLLRSEPETRVSLLFANRSEQDIMFRESLEALEAEHDRFSCTHLLEDNDEGIAEYEGRLNDEILRGFLTDEKVSDDAEYYICGPAPMMELTSSLLAECGVASDSVFIERFLDQSKSRSADPAALVDYNVKFQRSDIETTIRGDKSVLRGGHDAGVSIDFSCTMGGCAACKVKLVSGDVEMDEPNCLTSEERDEGYILACVSCPRSDLEVEC